MCSDGDQRYPAEDDRNRQPPDPPGYAAFARLLGTDDVVACRRAHQAIIRWSR